MASSTRYCLDIATCAIDGADLWLPPAKPAGNLKDPAKIAEDVARKHAAAVEGLALDPDLCRISALGICDVSGWGTAPVHVEVAYTEADERALLLDWRDRLRDATTITYNGLAFDLIVLTRRLLYLDIPALGWHLDKYRTDHIDLLSRLSGGDPTRRRPLGFYVRRLGWDDLSKPLSGAEEALAPVHGQWTELADSVRHDVTATMRLARWMGILPAAIAAEEVA
jgi:hypothetical protein